MSYPIHIRSGTTLRWRFRLHEVRRAAAARLGLYYRRAMSRRALRELDDHILRDIGLDRLDALREGTKPFWRP